MSKDKDCFNCLHYSACLWNGEYTPTPCRLYEDKTEWSKQSEGEWKQVYYSFPRYACTNCNHLYNNKEYKYCPNCGAKMRKEDEGK